MQLDEITKIIFVLLDNHFPMIFDETIEPFSLVRSTFFFPIILDFSFLRWFAYTHIPNFFLTFYHRIRARWYDFVIFDDFQLYFTTL
jgi:hypothetical protein